MHDSSPDEDERPSAEAATSAEGDLVEETMTLEQLFLELHLATENMGVILRKPRR